MSVDAAQEYNSGAGWEREHLWPQSLAKYHATSNDVPATDLHALRASLGRCNRHRSNSIFGEHGISFAPSLGVCPFLACASANAL